MQNGNDSQNAALNTVKEKILPISGDGPKPYVPMLFFWVLDLPSHFGVVAKPNGLAHN